MGCCTSHKLKDENIAFRTEKLPEFLLSFDETPMKILTFSISEFKLTKVFERITEFPCACTLFISTDTVKAILDLGDIWNFVNEFIVPKVVTLKLPENCEEIRISLCCLIENLQVEIGFVDLDLSAIENYFKGIVSLMYRCLNSVFLTGEIHLTTEPYEELAISFSSPALEKKRSIYFPSCEYPVDIKKYFTPNFSAEKWASKGSVQKEPTSDTIDYIKNLKTSYNELQNYLSSTHPDQIYYTLDRFLYFASQSVYASKIIEAKSARIKEIFQNFSSDKLIVQKNLWVVFELSRCLEGNIAELLPLYDADLIASILPVVHKRQIASLSIEIFARVISIGKLASLVIEIQSIFYPQVIATCIKYASLYNYAEICSGTIGIFFLMIQSANSSDIVTHI